MRKLQKQYSADFKARVVLEALREDRTLNEMASHYEVHPTAITRWKKQALEGLPGVFSAPMTGRTPDDALESDLYEQIGRLKVELEWLKKRWGPGLEERRAMIELGPPEISVRRQCALLGISRSGFYYEPEDPSPENMLLMGLLAIYPKPRLSVGGPENRKFPYLLRGVDILRPNQVWCADIT